ncbi:uncharacterized protein LOC134710973 [Mytilus trossulus]|uniref:uncharacterized protein LOC134710973 n=1 Tax=Mytilus trossulus TaxID=6551 RepID=UPI00300570E6
MHSDPKREDELPDIKQSDDPEQAFDESPPKLKEVVDVIKKGRAASAPGPNGVPYKYRKEGVSGCIEHTSVLSQIIREVKDSKGELAVVWLDLANAYGTVPHKLVELMLERYHVPDGVRALIKEYFNHLQLRFTVGDFTTSWQRLEVGIVTGCTISVILFSAAMNMIVKSVEKKSRGPWMKSEVLQPLGRAFMDDMTISTKTVIEARWTLRELDKMITWARMKVKPNKSRSLVVNNGKVKEERFKIGDEIIGNE